MKLRKLFFWLHLVIGLVSGLFVALLAFTGVTLAFEKDIIDFADRKVSRVEVPADSRRLELREVMSRLREYKAELKPTGITVKADPAAAIVVGVSREESLFVNPYTGEIREQASTGVRKFMHTMLELHRWLALSGDARGIGGHIVGAASLLFFILGLSGLILWWPRQYSWNAIRPTVLFRAGATGKMRDWNWHNVLGFWLLPILVLQSGTGVILSYKWANGLLFASVGEKVPERGGPQGGANNGNGVEIQRPSEDARPLSQDQLLALIQEKYPNWSSLNLNTGNGGRGRPSGGAERRQGGEGQRQGNGENASAKPAGEASVARGEAGAANGQSPARRGPQAVTVSLYEKDQFPNFASTMLTLNPYTGEVLKAEGFSTATTGRKLRSWVRFLHTGEALGVVGKSLWLIACLGGLVLVYTGFALSWRRFFRRKSLAQ